MKFLLALFFLVSCALGVSQPLGPDDLHGKTEAQVLAMGRSAWMDFSTSKTGGSTAGMAQAESVYGIVLRNRNDRLLQASPRGRREALQGLRKHLNDLAISMIDIRFAFSGGGTIWTPIGAGVAADVEEVVFELLTNGPRAPRRRVSDVVREFDRWSRELEKNRKELDEMAATGGGYWRAKVALGAARKSFEEARRIAARMPRAESDRVLEFARRKADATPSEG